MDEVVWDRIKDILLSLWNCLAGIIWAIYSFFEAVWKLIVFSIDYPLIGLLVLYLIIVMIYALFSALIGSFLALLGDSSSNADTENDALFACDKEKQRWDGVRAKATDDFGRMNAQRKGRGGRDYSI